MEYPCTNNQAKYEALLFGLQTLVDMGVKDVDASGDSLLVVQQIKGKFQCFDGLLNSYLDRCIIKTLLCETKTLLTPCPSLQTDPSK